MEVNQFTILLSISKDIKLCTKNTAALLSKNQTQNSSIILYSSFDLKLKLLLHFIHTLKTENKYINISKYKVKLWIENSLATTQKK